MQDEQVGGIFIINSFPVLLHLKPLYFAQEVLERSTTLRPDLLLEKSGGYTVLRTGIDTWEVRPRA